MRFCCDWGGLALRVSRYLLPAVFFCAPLASAQELISIRAEPSEVVAGTPAKIIVELQPSTVANGACGLLVSFGDGTSQQYRVENNNLPLTLTHTYSISGNVTVSAAGKMYLRGLNSVLGCFGNDQTYAMAVRPENLSEREAQELAAKNEALKRAAAERRAADELAKSAARDRAALEAAAQQAKADRAAAEAAARRSAAARTQAEQNAAKPMPPAANVTKPPPPQPRSVPAPAARAAAPVPQPAKPPPPKPKSSLDL